MSEKMSLRDLLENTDALTYVNALKVTLTEIKDEVSTQEDLRDYMNQSAERTKKLMRKVDGQYRMIARIITKETPVVTELIVVEDTIENFDKLKAEMEEV